MPAYYVNNVAQGNGDHEVHIDTCNFLPNDRKYLGYFTRCDEAVIEAKKTYRRSNGCYYCSRSCHTT